MTRPDRLPLVLLGVALVVLLVDACPADSQMPRSDEEAARAFQSLAWQRGPAEGRIGGTATIRVSDSQAFLDGPNSRRFLELNGNPPRDDHYTLVSLEPNWFAVFHFDGSGYVKDDERLDPDAILASLKEHDGPANAERKKLGMAPIYTDGWHVPPHYDTQTRRLEWGVRLHADAGPPVVNYTVRILGRHGVMSATLVSDPEHLDADIAAFKAALNGFGFTPGERYSEFRSGDKVAEYGLAALVLGGAAVVATKTGFLKAFGKLLLVGGVAIASGVAAFFRKVFGRS